jgi:hypothetical protein
MLVGVATLACVAACNDVAPPVNVRPASTPVAAAPATDPHAEEDNAPRITLADAKKDYDAGKAVIVDVRDPNTYNQEHIKGALNITPADLPGALDKLPKGKKIIAYCS